MSLIHRRNLAIAGNEEMEQAGQEAFQLAHDAALAAGATPAEARAKGADARNAARAAKADEIIARS